MPNRKMYSKIARLIMDSTDPGGEVVKLLEAIDENDPKMILITQRVPDDNENPIVEITIFTNKQTDFPIETPQLYIKWVENNLEWLKDNNQ